MCRGFHIESLTFVLDLMAALVLLPHSYFRFIPLLVTHHYFDQTSFARSPEFKELFMASNYIPETIEIKNVLCAFSSAHLNLCLSASSIYQTLVYAMISSFPLSQLECMGSRKSLLTQGFVTAWICLKAYSSLTHGFSIFFSRGCSSQL